ncbi:MAG: response regulator [Gallionella sp.]|nr:response regulator [Gallionella sp.]
MRPKIKNNTILLVEDDAAEVALARQACGVCDPPIELVVMHNSEEALAWIAQQMVAGITLPRLLLLDLKLPKLAGLAVLRKLRLDQRTLDMPIVTFSAIHEPADIVMSYRVGANSFVGKPSNLDEYRTLMQELVGYWFQPRQRELALLR